MKLSKYEVGKRYGKAIFELAVENDCLAQTHQELLELKSIFEKMPEIGHPLFGHNAYHIRPGKHNITEYDWKNFLEFLDICFKREKTPAS